MSYRTSFTCRSDFGRSLFLRSKNSVPQPVPSRRLDMPSWSLLEIELGSPSSSNRNMTSSSAPCGTTTRLVTVLVLRHGERSDEAQVQHHESRHKHGNLSAPRSRDPLHSLDPILTPTGYRQATEAWAQILRVLQAAPAKYEQVTRTSTMVGEHRHRVGIFCSPMRRTVGTALMLSAVTPASSPSPSSTMNGTKDAGGSAIQWTTPLGLSWDPHSYYNNTPRLSTLAATLPLESIASKQEQPDKSIGLPIPIGILDGLCDCAARVRKLGGTSQVLDANLLPCATTHRSNHSFSSSSYQALSIPPMALLNALPKPYNAERSSPNPDNTDAISDIDHLEEGHTFLYEIVQMMQTGVREAIYPVPVRKTPALFGDITPECKSNIYYNSSPLSKKLRTTHGSREGQHVQFLRIKDAMNQSGGNLNDTSFLALMTPPLNAYKGCLLVAEEQDFRPPATSMSTTDALQTPPRQQPPKHTIPIISTSKHFPSIMSRNDRRPLHPSHQPHWASPEFHRAIDDAVVMAANVMDDLSCSPSLDRNQCCDTIIVVAHREAIRCLAEERCANYDPHLHHFFTPYCCVGTFVATVTESSETRTLSTKRLSSIDGTASGPITEPDPSSADVKLIPTVTWQFHSVTDYQHFSQVHLP